MSGKVISVLTYKSKESIFNTGGSQSWALDPERARDCKYAVLCRNAKTRSPEGPEPHKSAFLVGKVSGIVPSTDNDSRWLILFSEYAECAWADEWEGRNPVAYYDTDQYDYDFDSLEFLPMPRQNAIFQRHGTNYVINVNLPPNLERHISDRVQEGHFMDANEFIRHLIRTDIARSGGGMVK